MTSGGFHWENFKLMNSRGIMVKCIKDHRIIRVGEELQDHRVQDEKKNLKCDNQGTDQY